MADEQLCRTSKLVTVVATMVDQVRIMLRRDNVQPLAAEGAVAVEQKTLASRKGPRLVSFCTPGPQFRVVRQYDMLTLLFDDQLGDELVLWR